MEFDQVIAHTSFLGHTGYNYHARNFFTHLNHLIPTRVRNYTHVDDISYLTKEQNDIIIKQTWNQPPWEVGIPLVEGKNLINIVLNETNHEFFYTNYKSPKIAYNVWESTRQPDAFFRKLLDYDQLWVPTEWQAQCSIEQGFPEDRVKVIPEGINPDIFKPYPIKQISGDKFRFLIFGRWDYRKGITECIRAFLNVFDKNEPVELIISVDNPYSVDGMHSTYERLKHHGLEDNRIKVLHFPPFEEYLKWLQSGDVFLSCSRGEGWNIPLLEAICCGTPTICSSHEGQMDFAYGISHKVNTKEMLKPRNIFIQGNDSPGYWHEPDWKHLEDVIHDTYENHVEYKKMALQASTLVRRAFSWENAVKIAYNEIDKFPSNRIPKQVKKPQNTVNYHFVDGPFMEILSDSDPEQKFKCIFTDLNDNNIQYETTIGVNQWTRANRKYFTNWNLRMETETGKVLLDHTFNLKGKDVLISLDSDALGDTLAWFPYIEEFRKKHGCNVFASTFWNKFFKETYPDITFINPGESVDNIYASYTIGSFYDDPKLYRNKKDWRTIPLQQIATDILGLEYKEIKPILDIHTEHSKPKEKYVCISEHSTAKCKLWNNYIVGWQELVYLLNEMDYNVVTISKENSNLTNVIHRTGTSIEDVIELLKYSEFFIGTSSGLSWLAWALNVPVYMISGFTESWYEFQDCNRIINEKVCHGCFNDANYMFDRGDWNWCPRNNDFECTKTITAEEVAHIIKSSQVLNHN